MKTKLLSAALAASLVVGGSAYAFAQTAQPTPAAQDAPSKRGGGGGMLMRADANKDGIVTRAELIADVEARFARRDTNKDGKITADERPGKGMRGRRGGNEGTGGRMASRLDINNDGAIGKAEQVAQATRLFDYVDRNGDGKVDKAERDALRDAMSMLHRGKGGHDRHGRHGRHGGHERHAPPPAGAPNAPKGS